MTYNVEILLGDWITLEVEATSRAEAVEKAIQEFRKTYSINDIGFDVKSVREKDEND